jgi:hypothetical protein
MNWTVQDVSAANHNPVVLVNGQAGKAPILLNARVGAPLTLDAAGTKDPEGDALSYNWFFYSEAGTGIPGQRVARGRPATPGGVSGQGGIPSGPAGGPRQPPPRVTLAGETTARVTVTPQVAGTSHIILVVEDNGSPSLTSYRRIILSIGAK